MGRTLQRYKKLFEDLKKSPPGRVYFLYGPEEHIKKEYVGELMKRTLRDENQAFNLDVLHGDEFERERFDDRMSSFPLFTERRMIVVKKFEALPLAGKDLIVERIGAGLPESVVLVVECGNDKLDSARLKKIDKLATAHGVSFRFQFLSDEETVERIKSRLRREGKAIDPPALDLLVTSVGTHLTDLNNELDKIVLSSGDEKAITRELVAEVVGKYRTENIFAFLDELGGDVGRVIRKVNRVIDGGEEPVFVMALLTRRVLQLMQVQALLAEQGARLRSPRAMADRIGGYVSPFQAGRLLDQIGRFDAGILKTYLENLRWADIKLKSTSLPARSVIETSLLASSVRKTLALSAN
ncbi:MAG: DNA polymerase III subunit delta [Candidatus Krumholzibacteriia bacterium]